MYCIHSISRPGRLPVILGGTYWNLNFSILFLKISHSWGKINGKYSRNVIVNPEVMIHKMAWQRGHMTRVFSETFKRRFAAILMKQKLFWGVSNSTTYFKLKMTLMSGYRGMSGYWNGYGIDFCSFWRCVISYTFQHFVIIILQCIL